MAHVPPPELAKRLEGTSISLDDYVRYEVNTFEQYWPGGMQSNYKYRIRPDHENVTSGSTFLSAVESIWGSMPEIATLVESYGDPPGLAFAHEHDSGVVHLNLLYPTGSLFVGPTGTQVREIRFENDEDDFQVDGVGVGASISDVTAAFGAPISTVEGPIEFDDRILYLEPEGPGYISYRTQGIRFFFGFPESGRPVSAMYLATPQ